MRALLAALALVLAMPSALALVGCAGPVCADVDSFSGSCDTFAMEYARVLAPGVVIYAGHWCGAGFNGARADVIVTTPAGVISTDVVWAESFGDCFTFFSVNTPATGNINDAVGCPAGAPPGIPPVLP